MEVGDGLISLSTSGGHGRQSPRLAGAITQSVKVYVDGIDRHFARAKAAGATIISEPDDKFWGGRIYEAKDIEGHYWDFSERGRGLDPTEWKLPPASKWARNARPAQKAVSLSSGLAPCRGAQNPCSTSVCSILGEIERYGQ